jgi:outer membrane protein assembly factor BamA
MFNSGANLQLYLPARVIMVMLLSFLSLTLTAQYRVNYEIVDKDSTVLKAKAGLLTDFKTKPDAEEYLLKLPVSLAAKGFVTASIDSLKVDSLSAYVELFLGAQYRWTSLTLDSADAIFLRNAGLVLPGSSARASGFNAVSNLQQKILDYYENNGYPFANIQLDSIQINDDQISGKLKVEKGPLYKIDSVRNMGNAKVSSNYLEHYLGFSPGTIFKKEKLQSISQRIQELTFVSEVKPWDLTMLGTGSILNLYLDNRKSSQVNVLIGLLPASTQLANNKMQVTGEANINLKNALGNGETIGLNWQNIQVKSPRLNILYQHPYLFKTPIGVNFNFDLFKKDSSFININFLIGAQYALSSRQSGSVFLQNMSSNLLTVDTFRVKAFRQLPDQADISSVNLGVSYEVNTTDYRFNPRKGNELNLSFSAGTKSIKKNNVIVQLFDESDPTFDFNSLYDTIKLKSYQFRMKLAAAHYFPVTRASTIRTAINAGWFQSENIFRNEVFQIGGYKLLRGFDEESQFASQYAVLTAEYRYLLGRNSFFFGFVDGGYTKNASLKSSPAYNYIGTGLGMAFETKAGIFNLSWAVGKRSDARFDFRQSKIHLGYVNYF